MKPLERWFGPITRRSKARPQALANVGAFCGPWTGVNGGTEPALWLLISTFVLLGGRSWNTYFYNFVWPPFFQKLFLFGCHFGRNLGHLKNQLEQEASLFEGPEPAFSKAPPIKPKKQKPKTRTTSTPNNPRIREKRKKAKKQNNSNDNNDDDNNNDNYINLGALTKERGNRHEVFRF